MIFPILCVNIYGRFQGIEYTARVTVRELTEDDSGDVLLLTVRNIEGTQNFTMTLPTVEPGEKRGYFFFTKI